MSADWPEVAGICPACGWHSLFLGAGGFVTCSRLECPAPEAASDLLALEPSATRLAVEASRVRSFRARLVVGAGQDPAEVQRTLEAIAPPVEGDA